MPNYQNLKKRIDALDDGNIDCYCLSETKLDDGTYEGKINSIAGEIIINYTDDKDMNIQLKKNGINSDDAKTILVIFKAEEIS